MAEIKNQDMEEEVAQALIQLCCDTMLKVRLRAPLSSDIIMARRLGGREAGEQGRVQRGGRQGAGPTPPRFTPTFERTLRVEGQAEAWLRQSAHLDGVHGAWGTELLPSLRDPASPDLFRVTAPAHTFRTSTA